MKRPPPFEYGTVPYHQHYAGFYRRQVVLYRVFSPLIAVNILANSGYKLFDLILTLVNIALLFWCGMRLQACQQERRRHEGLAWQRETSETVAGMLSSGIYTDMFEVLDAMRDGPTPPGWKRKDWLRSHDSTVAEMRAQLGD